MTVHLHHEEMVSIMGRRLLLHKAIFTFGISDSVIQCSAHYKIIGFAFFSICIEYYSLHKEPGKYYFQVFSLTCAFAEHFCKEY